MNTNFKSPALISVKISKQTIQVAQRFATAQLIHSTWRSACWYDFYNTKYPIAPHWYLQTVNSPIDQTMMTWCSAGQHDSHLENTWEPVFRSCQFRMTKSTRGNAYPAIASHHHARKKRYVTSSRLNDKLTTRMDPQMPVRSEPVRSEPVRSDSLPMAQTLPAISSFQCHQHQWNPFYPILLILHSSRIRYPGFQKCEHAHGINQLNWAPSIQIELAAWCVYRDDCVEIIWHQSISLLQTSPNFANLKFQIPYRT